MNFYTLLKLHKRIKSRNLKLIGLWIASVMGMRHLSVRIDPAIACNLACQMCYFSSPGYRKENTGFLNESEIENIARVLFPKAFQVVVGCGAEPTMHDHYQRIFQLASQYGVSEVSIVTNAQLIEKQDLSLMAEADVGEIVISVHGVLEETYEKFMSGARFSKLKEVLDNLSDLRGDNIRDSFPELRINYTVNAENLEELTRFFEVFDVYNVNTLQVRPAMNLNGRYQDGISSDLLPRYKAIISFLNDECRQRGIRLLANIEDAAYTRENPDSDIAALVYTYISPRTSSQLEIDWSNCSFKKFRKADRWMERFKNTFFKRGGSGDGLKRSMKYDTL